MAKEVMLQVNIESNEMPFAVHVSNTEAKRKLGIANGKYMIPNNIDKCNDKIAEMFGVDEE